MILSAALAVVAPPPPPPPADRMAAARILIAAHPYPAEEKTRAVAVAIEILARSALDQVWKKPKDAGWVAKLEGMTVQMRSAVPADPAQMEDAVANCLAEPLAWALAPDEAAAATAFFDTPAGRNVWGVIGYRRDELTRCYQSFLVWRVDTDAALRAVGLTPPVHQPFYGD